MSDNTPDNQFMSQKSQTVIKCLFMSIIPLILAGKAISSVLSGFWALLGPLFSVAAIIAAIWGSVKLVRKFNLEALAKREAERAEQADQRFKETETPALSERIERYFGYLKRILDQITYEPVHRFAETLYNQYDALWNRGKNKEAIPILVRYLSMTGKRLQEYIHDPRAEKITKELNILTKGFEKECADLALQAQASESDIAARLSDLDIELRAMELNMAQDGILVKEEMKVK